MTKKFRIDRKKVGLMVAIIGFAFIATLVVIRAYDGKGTPKVVVEGNYIEASNPNGVGEIQFGAVGAQLVEDYIPAIEFNGGYNSNLDMQLAGLFTANGTSTVGKSYDGFIAQANFTMSTGTAKAVISNTTGADWLCDRGTIYFDSTGYSPALYVAIGTTTSATAYSAGMMASTTVATTTDQAIQPYAQSFILATGKNLVASLSDNFTPASSTNYGNWDAEMAFQCWLMGQ